MRCIATFCLIFLPVIAATQDNPAVRAQQNSYANQRYLESQQRQNQMYQEQQHIWQEQQTYQQQQQIYQQQQAYQQQLYQQQKQEEAAAVARLRREYGDKKECDDDNKLGQVCRFYYDDAHKRLRVVMSWDAQGDMHGNIKRYHTNGKLYSDQHWLHGKTDGEWREYDEEGNLTAIQEHRNNRIIRHQPIANGVPHGAEEYYFYDENGDPKSKKIIYWNHGVRESEG